jgi:hypothetical protein
MLVPWTDRVVQSGDGDKRVTRDVGFGRAVVGGFAAE